RERRDFEPSRVRFGTPLRVRFGTPLRVRFGTTWRAHFGTTRGHGSIWLSPFYLAAFLARLIGRKAIGRVDLVHINLSSDGSARRKAIVGKVAQCLGVPYVIHLHGSRF